eukprot:jgi/Tetstr1/427874/TSEL_017951.t2
MNLPAPGDAHWRVQHDAIADAFRDHCVHDLGIAVRREVDDLFQQAVPLGNTVPRDELKDLVPDAELSLPAFNVVTGSYDPRSLKSTLLEFKTMRYGVKYTSVPRATAVDRFERSLLGDIQRGLAARDAAWHNTEPGQKGPLRDILDMSEYTGMVFGTVGEVSKGVHRTTFLGAALVKVTAEYSAHRTVRLNHPHDGHDGSTTRLPYYQLNTRHIIIKDDFDNHRDNIKQLMASTAKPISLLIADNNYKLNWGPWDVAWTSEFKNTLNLVDHCNDGLQNCKFISFLTDQALPHAMAAISERDMQFKLFYY